MRRLLVLVLMIAVTPARADGPGRMFGSSLGKTFKFANVSAAIPMVMVAPNAVAYSRDSGITWTLGTIPAGGWNNVMWIGDKYVAIGATGPSTATCATSADGITWVSRTIQQQNWTGLGTNGVVTVAQGAGGALSTTPDGITWTGQTPISGGPNLNKKIVWSSTLGLFVGVGINIYSSPDGIAWTQRLAATMNSALAWSAPIGLFVAFRGNAQNMRTSANGTAWTSRTFADPNFRDWRGAAWNGSVFAVIPTSPPAGSATSSDGINWTFGTSITSRAYDSLTVSGTRFVGVGANAVITSDDNGLTWTDRTSPVNVGWLSVAAPVTGS